MKQSLRHSLFVYHNLFKLGCTVCLLFTISLSIYDLNFQAVIFIIKDLWCGSFLANLF